jgi:hypothetical protein
MSGDDEKAATESRIAILERELKASNAANAELQRQVRVLDSKARAYDERDAEAKTLRAEVEDLRRRLGEQPKETPPPHAAPPATEVPSPLQPGSASRIEQLRSELEALAAPDQPGHVTGWQSKPTATQPTEADEVERLMAMQQDANRVEDAEDAELAARIARLRGK